MDTDDSDSANTDADTPLRFYLSPLLPVQPDWQKLALEASDAYFQLMRVKAAVADRIVDGHEYWAAITRMERVASEIMCWRDDADLYGRLLARDRISAEIEREEQKPYQQRVIGVCPLVADNRPYADHCVQCEAALGV